ncbi:MAG TPA: DUF6799 domain-containing protein [Flavisolibacter sp.]|nr:DUF6799 domain-containing protein [Flavisolibacter sp.]
MKKLFLLTLLGLFTLTMNAQQTNMKTKTQKSTSMSKDCVMMENGKMMVMKGGQSSDMTQDMTMSNGSVVMADGTVKMKNGKTMKLKNGDCVWMNGNVTHAKTKSSSGKKEKM